LSLTVNKLSFYRIVLINCDRDVLYIQVLFIILFIIAFDLLSLTNKQTNKQTTIGQCFFRKPRRKRFVFEMKSDVIIYCRLVVLTLVVIDVIKKGQMSLDEIMLFPIYCLVCVAFIIIAIGVVVFYYRRRYIYLWVVTHSSFIMTAMIKQTPSCSSSH